MGRPHRENRKATKRKVREILAEGFLPDLYWKLLKGPRFSKAVVRRAYVSAWRWFQMERDVSNRSQDIVRAEIRAIEDQRLFRVLEKTNDRGC